MTAVARQLPRFLGTSRAVDLVARLNRRNGSTCISADTLRWSLGNVDAYGTRVEVPVEPPQPGPTVYVRLDHLSASSSRYHLSPRVIDGHGTSLFLDTSLASDGGPAALRPDTGQVEIEGRLISRGLDIDGLTRMGPSTWPAHEQIWQVQHRFAYPTGIATDGSCAFISFDLAHDEQIFGLGEDFGPLAKNGSSHRLWMEEAFNNSSPARYKPIPFLWSTAGWGLLVNSTNAVRVDVGSLDHSALSIVVDDTDELDIVLMTGETPAELLAEYARITSHPRVPPRWTFGNWQGRISYASQDEVLAVAARLRQRKLPCDVIHIDTNWFGDDWACDYRFDSTRFPDPAQMLATLRADGFRVCVWQWPNAMTGTSTFDEGAADGWLVTDSTGQPFTQPGFVRPAGVIDYSNPAAATWIAEQLRPLLQMGVAAIKTDFGEGAPTNGTYHSLNAASAHNAYPLLYNQAVMQALDAELGDGEGVVWSRSGWAGSQRFPIHWSGDGVARFADLATVLRATLSIGLSGIPFYAHDIGGFSGVPSNELMVRWTQLGVLSSHLRYHGFPPREPWEFGDAEDTIRNWLDLRYQLLPYLWASADESGRTGLPMCRAMVLAYPDDPTCRHIDDQYLLGSDLLCAPILTSGTSRRIYVPDDQWIDWWTDRPIQPGWHVVSAPLDRAPLYRRSGVDIPLAPPGVQHTGQLLT